MARSARLTLIALLAAGAAPATGPATTPAATPVAGPAVESLVRRLGAADPAARQEAYDALRRLVPPPTAALRAAARGPNPAVATAAAGLLLAGITPDPHDPVAARNLLTGYGNWQVEGRIERLQQVLGLPVPGAARAAVRVAALDPSDDVAWALFEVRRPDRAAEAALAGALAAAEDALAALDPATRPPGLTVALARALLARNDLAALPLIRGVVEAETRQPTADPSQLATAVRVLSDAEARQGDPAVAAVRLRELLAAAVDAGDRDTLTDQLLALQAGHGPLAGLADDLKKADADVESHGNFVLSRLARRAGLATAAGALLGAAVADRQGESDVDRAARLADAADWLRTNGDLDAASRAYEKLTAVETEAVRGRVLMAYLRLAELHEQAGRFGLAGDAMQRVLARENGQLTQTRNGQPEMWSIEDQQAKTYYYFLLDALARGDAAAVATQAQNMIASGSTDDTLFLNALPHLEPLAKAGQIDAYFDRVFDRSKARLAEYPEQPVFYNDLAWLCARSGRRLPEAVAWAERAVTAEPTTAAYLDTLAEAKFRTGRVQEAIDLEIRAIALRPEEVDFMEKQLARFRRGLPTTRPN